MDNMDPKKLRAQAKKLLELARTIEMAQDPQAYFQKSMNQKIGGKKRQMQYGLARSLKSPK